MAQTAKAPRENRTITVDFHDEAKRQGTSVEQVAGQLLRRALEGERYQSELPTYHDLDALAGTWSEDEATAFLEGIADFEQVDSELWR